MIDKLSNTAVNKQKYSFKQASKNEGLMTQSNVQYVAKGYNFIELGHSYSGSLQVLKTIIGLDYLWNRVRVQGGAYGALLVAQEQGMYFSHPIEILI